MKVLDTIGTIISAAFAISILTIFAIGFVKSFLLEKYQKRLEIIDEWAVRIGMYSGIAMVAGAIIYIVIALFRKFLN